MSKLISSISNTMLVYRKDKWVTVLSLIPIAIGALLFVFLWSYIYTDILAWGQNLIKEYVSGSSLGQILYYTLLGVLTIAFYFIVSYGFVLVVSLFSSPFNDMISNRVERFLLGQAPEAIGDTVKGTFSQLAHILKNEFKKIITIFSLTVLAFAISFFPLLAPVSFVISALLLSVSFLEFSWSRHWFSFPQMRKDLQKNFTIYLLAGIGFLFLISIPFLNILAFGFGVSFFTCLFVNLNEVDVKEMVAKSK